MELIPHFQMCAIYSIPVPQTFPKKKFFYLDPFLTLANLNHWAEVTRLRRYFLSLAPLWCHGHPPTQLSSLSPSFLLVLALVVSML